MSTPCLLLGLGLLLLAPPTPEDEAPPPAIERPFAERASARAAQMLRPWMPARYATASDARVCAMGALWLGLGLGGVLATLGTLRFAKSLPRRARAQQQAWRERRDAAHRAVLETWLEATELQLGTHPSIHEAVTAAGVEEQTLRALGTAAHQEETSVRKFPGWPTVLAAAGEKSISRMGLLQRRFVYDLLKAHALHACAADPQLGRRNLHAEVVVGDDPWDIDFAFLQASGLGATLDGDQRAAYRRILEAATRARAHLPNPYVVSTFLRELRGTAAKSNGGEAQDDVAGVPVASVLLFGADAFRRAGPFFRGPLHTAELEEALTRHAEVIGSPVEAEGVAVRLAQRAQAGALPGIGSILAAVAGAALKPPAASLRLRQGLGKLLADNAVAAPLAALGDHVAKGLLEPARLRDLSDGAQTVCAVRLLEYAHRAAQELQTRLGPGGADVTRRRWKPPTLAEAVLEQHRVSTQAVAGAATAAAGRLIELLRVFTTPELAAPFRSQALVGAVVAALDSEPLLSALALEALNLRRQARAALAVRGMPWI